MGKINKPLLNAFQGEAVWPRPVWLMRQAGRYLPEYRAIREEAGSFLNLCLNPTKAAEVTLQPVTRFGLDGAILFADILLLPMAMGQELRFEEGEGPLLHPIEDLASLDKLSYDEKKIEAVFETIRLVQEKLPETVTFLGFSGGLWTVACYMIEGCGKSGFEKAVLKAETDHVFMESLFAKLLEATFQYLDKQVEAGVEALQIFESHAGLLTDGAFDKWIIKPTRQLVSLLKKKHPHVPLIGFPRGATMDQLEAYFKETGVDVLGLDQSVDLSEAHRRLAPLGCLQGNLDPEALLSGGEIMRVLTREIIQKLGPSHVFNLGHGVIKETPPDHVAALVDFIHALQE